MALDISGTALGTLIATALALPTPPIDPLPEQLVAYNAAVAANLTTWITISQQILTYITTNAVVATTDSVTVPGTGLVAPVGGGPVTGAAVGSGSGTGTIQ